MSLIKSKKGPLVVSEKLRNMAELGISLPPRLVGRDVGRDESPNQLRVKWLLQRNP